MFINKNIVKKISMVVASLALIIPLASVNGASVSAHHIYKHVHIICVIKNHTKRDRHIRKHIVKHMRIGSTNNYYDYRVNSALDKEPKNKAYKVGFNDALNAKVNHKLVHNKDYEKGYLQIIALDNYTAPNSNNIPKHLSNNALNDAKVFYNYCILK